MTDAERNKLAHAFDELFELAERECCWESEIGQEHRCSCEPCIARRARSKIEEAIDPPNVSLQENRLTSPPERVFLEKWRKDNVRTPGLNSGFTTLEWILCPSDQKRPGMVSHRDAQVAASVIQWLGTNCGQSFIISCEQEIRKLDANFRGLRPIDTFNTYEPKDQPKAVLEGLFVETAEYVAGQFFPITHQRYPHLRAAILRALRAAEKRAAITFEVSGAGI